MSDDLEAQFADIAQHAISKAEDIECPLSTFRDGLKIIVEEVRARLNSVESELDEDE